jgi:anti-sigma28 factor (negative regulator of flagellin synthesis)
MSEQIEWVVTRVPVRHADRAPLAQANDGRDGRERAVMTGHDRESKLPSDRVAELRQRVRTGAYDNRIVAEQVARRILQSGDL